jgi:cytochrome c peroxidase
LASELVSGIPGEGPLSVDEIKKWLAQTGVHDPIAVELPLGLSLGQGQIKGLDKNPLTRAKIELGRQLYFDARLSADNTISCASCHSPDEGWTRSTQFGVGIKGQTGNRNSPVSFNRILSDVQFWDGRAASLEDQAVGPIQNPIEMGNTHEKAVEAVKGIEGYRVQFEAVFGSEGVTIGNVGKAIATFERAVVTNPSPYDYHEVLRPFLKMSADDLADLKNDAPEAFAKYEAARKAGEPHPMSESAIRGRELFFTEKGNCSTCHVGANFSDEKYHNLGVGMDKPEPDLRRLLPSKGRKDKGAFKTPTIRNIVQTGPYMHDGSQKTLEEVVEWYDKGGHPNPHLSDKMKKLKLSEQDKKDLVEFLKACTGEFPKIATGRLPK